MRRIIHNTTAIAACLSLLAPHLAMAQTETPAADTAEQAAPAPDTCADGAAPPCDTAAEAAVETPETETAAEAEVATEAEAEAEVAPAEPAAAAEPAPEEAPAAEATPAEAEAAPAEEPAAEEPAAEATPAPAAEAEVKAAPAAEAAPEAAIAPAPSDADALKAAMEAKETADVPEAAAEGEAAPAAEAEADPATDTDALKAALDAEAAKDAPKAEASAETAAPEAKAEAEAKPDSETGSADTTAADATTETKAPEADAVETEASKEAAAAVAAPAAAALSAGAGEGEVTEEKVTEENSRSSSEDFATNLTDALEGAPAAQQAKNDDDGDDKKDLAKALLLGLGGVAVGAMLANNRQVALSSPDRVVVTRADGSQQVIKDEVALLRQPGSTVTTENFNDGSSRTIVTRADGSQVVTIRDADLRVLRRTLVTTDGRTQELIDDTAAQPVDLASLPKPATTNTATASQMDEAQLRDALMAASAADRRFTLSQIRDIAQVRSLVAPVNIDSITFDTGSAAIKSDQAEQLSALGKVIRDSIAENPGEMFMIEGYTDTVGSDAANLALSDRRAESVALALTEYFDVPPENMVVQGYGEEFLLVNREGDLRENRRASVRRITELLQTASN